jgi:uncharacterized membrane protein YczE
MVAAELPVAPMALRVRLPRRLVQLHVGLVLYGVGIALQLRAGLGLDPWDVLHQGVSRRIGLSFGTTVIVVGALVLLLWVPLRQRPGIGTVSNAIVIGLVVDGTLAVVPEPSGVAVRWALLLGGVLAGGVATGCYIGAGLGPGPRDGLMTGLTARTGRSIRLVRSCLELTVLAAGYLLGGTVGIGTVVYAVAIGPLAHVFIPLFSRWSMTTSQSAGVEVEVPEESGGGEGVGDLACAEEVG